jgi:glycolate oxidase FAD binding subunit
MDTPAALQERVALALADDESLHISAGDTKLRLGRRVVAQSPLDVSGLNQLVSYEPGELILVVRPGMPLGQIEKLLARENQHLAFEPPHWGTQATIGGTLACNLSGPRRFKAGALRDFVLGIEMINGHGERIRAGGKVVKNVTGYDLPRALTGSFGTLGVLTEICLKLWPRPQSERTVLIEGLGIVEAAETLMSWARLPCEISGLAWFPAGGEDNRTFARVEGLEAAVVEQAETLAREAGSAAGILDAGQSRRTWGDIRELSAMQPGAGEELWRFSVPPSAAVSLVERLRPQGLVRCGLDQAGATVWALMRAGCDRAALHTSALACGGGAWRFSTGPQDDNEEAFTPLPPPLMAANRALKKALDPRSILNRGRMYPDL